MNIDYRSVLENNDNLEGALDFDAPLAGFTWFKVGGNADCLYRPSDEDDLACFLSLLPKNVPTTTIGAASNLLVRDGGVRGVVIRLGRGFGQMQRLEDNDVLVGAAVPDVNVARFLSEQALDGGSFLRGIPGTIGGALKMNAGAYGSELKDIFVQAYGVTHEGHKVILNADDMGFVYRNSKPKDIIFTAVRLRLRPGDKEKILADMEEITRKRAETQPVKSQTGGSTFKNPEGYQAWKLIHEAGCRGLTIGQAQMSELHSNFMLNLGNATAYDLELLGETVRQRVFEHSGIKLEWEIKRIGEFGNQVVRPAF